MENFKVDCVINAGVKKYKDETQVAIPLLVKNNDYEPAIKCFDKDCFDFSDTRSYGISSNFNSRTI